MPQAGTSRLRIGRRAARLGVAAAVLSGLASGCGRGTDDTPTAPLNVIVVTLDALRADYLGTCGNPRGVSPELDAFAGRSTHFVNAVTAIATTFPSHSTVFTGVYPRLHGVRWNGHRLRDQWVTLAEVLSEHGYDTAAMVSYRSMVNRGGLGQGFATLSDSTQDDGPRIRDGAETTAMAVDWLGQRDPSSPFFLWLHLFEPHSPYPLTPYAAEHLGDYDGLFADGAGVLEIASLRDPETQLPEDMAALRTLYAGGVLTCDLLFGRFLDSLEKMGLRENTLVLVAADHGEMLGEHGDLGHGPLFWEDVLVVPLFIAHPEGLPGLAAERAGLVDVMATVLDCLDLPIPDASQGRSLLPAILGDVLPPRVYYAEARVPSQVSHKDRDYAESESVAAWRLDSKLILGDAGARVYDLAVDPGESQPQTEDGTSALAELARIHRTGGHVEPDVELDDETLEELRALGYVD
ncbi:MAG: hypothetical protein DHS20C21_20350 [Gemmatimonadota bacterium]|nr:MAG: hypothetical protein DHS20C21_20350 [Gemmatimonadota bacterium]